MDHGDPAQLQHPAVPDMRKTEDVLGLTIRYRSRQPTHAAS